MSFKKSKDNYNKAFDLYDEIREEWERIESGEATYPLYKIQDTLKDIKKLRKYLEGISLEDIKGKVPIEKYKDVKHNYDLFEEATYYIEKSLYQMYYIDKLKPAVQEYIEQLNLDKKHIEKWGGSLEEVTKNFVATVTHTKRIMDYLNEIKRLMKGKMSMKEFSRIFDALKSKMTQRHVKMKREKRPPSELPPKMWPEEKQKGYWDKFYSRWESDEEKEQRAKKLGVRAKPPKKDFKEKNQYYIVTPEGVKIPYSQEVQTKDGVVRYMDEKGEPVYSYLKEGVYPSFSNFLKMMKS